MIEHPSRLSGRRILFVSVATFAVLASLIAATAYAICVPQSYSVTSSAPPPVGNWTDTTGAVWTPAGGFPGCSPGDTASDTNASPTTLVVNSSIPNPILGLTLACPGCVIDIQSGGSLTLAGSGSIGAGATILVSGGTLTIASGGDLTVQPGGTLNVTGGGLVDIQTTGGLTLAGSGVVGSGANLNVNGGTLTVQSGTTLTVQSGGQLQLSDGNVTGTGTISNTGTVVMGGSGVVSVSPVLNNNTAGGGVTVFTGTLALSGGGTADAPFTIDSGAILDFPSGAYTMTPNGTVTGGGTLSVTGGTVSIGGVTTPGGLFMTGGMLTGNGFLSITSTMMWSGGTITGTGGTELAGSGSGFIDGAVAQPVLDGRVFNLYGYLVYDATTNPLLLANAAVFNVYGTFDIESDGSIDGSAPAALNVPPNGFLVKGGGIGTTTINPPVTNDATIYASTATLAFSGGGTHSGFFFADSGATLAFTGGSTTFNGFQGGGTFAFSGSNNVINGPYTADLTTISSAYVATTVPADTTDFSMDSGTLDAGAMFVMYGLGAWGGGTITGPAPFVVDGGATLTIDASLDSPYLGSGTILNDGTVNYLGTSPNAFILTGSAVIDNAGTFDIQTDRPIEVGIVGSVAALVSSGNPLIDNTGTLKKTCCGGTTDVQPDVANSGMIDALDGILNISGAFSQSAGATTLGPGSINSALPFAMSGGVLAGTGTFTGDVNNSGGNVSPGSSPGTLAITGNYTQGSGATMTVELASASSFDQLNVSGSATLDGTLDVSLLGGYQPANGTVFPVLAFASRSGDFATKNLPTYGLGGTITDSYTPTGLLLTAALPPSADVQIVKTGPGGVTAGQTVSYTITVTNNGPDPATGVFVSDPTPANLSFVSNTGACTSPFPCNLGTLNSGQSATITATYGTAGTFAGNVTNTATVSSLITDPNTGNNSSSATTNVGAQADLSIVKSGPVSVVPGQNLVYTITVTNAGPSPATGVTVSDLTPVGLAFQSNSGACTTSYPCSIGTLAAGQSATITSTYTVPANYASSSISNTASVSSTVNDPNSTDNASSTTTTVTQTADLAITKSGPASAGTGQNIVYTITVTNSGPSSATGVVVSDATPAGLNFVSNSGACVAAFPCTLGTLASGQTATITSTYFIPAGYSAASITNTASVSSGVSDPSNTNNTSSATTTIAAQADLSVVKTGPASVIPGQNVVFTVVVTNNGTLAASNAVVADSTPAGLTFVSNSGACASPYPCALGNLAAGQSATITSTYAVPANYASPGITNTATVSSATTDLNSSNNSSTATVLLGSASDITVAKSGPPTAFDGSNVDYTIVVRNNGPAAASNITVTDPTPTGLAFVGNSGACTTAFPCTIAALAAGQSVTITSSYNVQAGVGATVVNAVSVATSSDPLVTNNASQASTQVITSTVCPGPAILVAPGANAVLQSPVAFEWTSVPGAVSYTVNIGGAASSSVSTSATTATIPLAAGEYSWSVTADVPGCVPATSGASAFVVCAPPVAPVASVIAQSTAGQTYDVSWNSVPGATRYELEESLESTFRSPVSSTMTTTARSFTKNVTQGTAFFYRVRAFSACGLAGAYSPIIRVAVLPVPVPGNDANITVQVGSTTPVTFTVFVPGQPAGITSFVATSDRAWMSVFPTSGLVPPAGTFLTVQLDPSQLDNGTWTGTILVVYGTVNVTSSAAVRGTATPPPSTSIPVSLSLVTPVTPVAAFTPASNAVIVPTVGHLAGLESSWRSDLRLANVGGSPQKYTLTLSAPSADTPLKQTTVTAAAGATLALDDVVRSWYGVGSLGESGGGVLTIQPVSVVGPPVVSSRTFNAAATGGTLGQFIPAIPFSALVGASGDRSAILSLQQIAQTSAYRTNVGVVESASKPVSASVSVFDAIGSKLLEVPLTLAAGEQKQLNGFLSQNGITLPNGRIEVKATEGAGKISAYASVIDNATNDPLYVSGVPLGGAGAGAGRYVIPGVSSVETADASWRSDVRVFNPAAAPVQTTMTFYPEGDPASSRSQNVTINAGEVRALDDVIQSVFGVRGGGALHVAAATAAPLVVTTRTYDQTATGTVGQFITAVTPEQATGVGGRALQILQVEDSSRYRANVGVAEVSGKTATVEITVNLPESKVSPKVQLTLRPFEFRQLPVVSGLGLGAVYNARLSVSVVSGDGRVTGYASVIDRTTGDPTYIQSQ